MVYTYTVSALSRIESNVPAFLMRSIFSQNGLEATAAVVEYLCFAILFTLSWAANITTSKKRPNIIFILTDDQDVHMDSLEYMPSLQRHLVRPGTIYKRNYCTISLCCPSRASLWTGRFSHNTNVTDLAPPYVRCSFRFPTIALLF